MAAPRSLCLEQPFSLVAVNGNEGVYCGDRDSPECGLSWRLQLTPLGGRSTNFTLNTVLVTTDLYDDLLGALEDVNGWAMCVQQLVPSVRVYVWFRGGYLSWRFRYARGNCSSFSQPTGYTLYGTLPDGTSLAPISSTNFSGLVVPCGATPPPATNGQDQPSAVCGNGILEGNEQCDPPGPCCTEFCEFREPGTTCDDGDACTVQDHCAGGAECLGTPLSCDDGEQCTRDSCVAGQCINDWQLQQRGCRQGPPPPLPDCAANCTSVTLADYCRAAGIRLSTGHNDGDNDSTATGLVAAVAVLSLLCAVLIVLLVVVSVWGLGFVATMWSWLPSMQRTTPPADVERLVYQAPQDTVTEVAEDKAMKELINRAMDQVNARAETDQQLKDELERQRTAAALILRQEQERAAAGVRAPVSPATMSPFEQQRAEHARQQQVEAARVAASYVSAASFPIGAAVQVQSAIHWSQTPPLPAALPRDNHGTLGGPSYVSASTGVSIPTGWPSTRSSPPPAGFSATDEW